jgi:hypothetical protein
MLECWETRGERSYATSYVLKETSRRPATFTQGPWPRRSESPLVEAICRIVGLLMFAATGLLIWIMATATQ